MPHECLHWRTKKAENIMSTCILLCQLRLGCFLNKFLAKWQVSWKMQAGLQPATELWEQLKACRLGRKSNNNNNKPTQKTEMQRRLQLLGTNDKTKKIAALNPQQFCWRWTGYPILLKQKNILFPLSPAFQLSFASKLSLLLSTPFLLPHSPFPFLFSLFSLIPSGKFWQTSPALP